MVSLPKEKLPGPRPHESSPFGSVSYHPLAEYSFSSGDPQFMAHLAQTHTPVEHLLDQVMLAEVTAAGTRACTFSSRHLMALSRLPNYRAIRRGVQGLINKQSTAATRFGFQPHTTVTPTPTRM